jgi:hypothetical protein
VKIQTAATQASAPAVAYAIAAQIISAYGKDAPAMAGMISDEVSRQMHAAYARAVDEVRG